MGGLSTWGRKEDGFVAAAGLAAHMLLSRKFPFTADTCGMIEQTNKALCFYSFFLKLDPKEK